MDDNTTPAPEAEAQTAAPVQQAHENAAETEQEDDLGIEGLDEADLDDSEGEPSEAEIEYEGKKYKVSPEIKDAIMRHADYTRKTQEVAEQRRQAEAIKEQASKALQATEQELNIRGELATMAKTIEQYEKVDWNALEQEDPLGAQSHWRQYQQLKDNAQRHWNELGALQQQRVANEQQDIATRVTTSREQASKQLKGWSAEREQKAFDWAVKDLGLPIDLLKAGMSPAVYKGVYLAWLGQQVHDRPAKPKAAPAQAQDTQQPITRLAGKNGAAPRGLRDDLSVDEWMKRRQEQLKRSA